MPSRKRRTKSKRKKRAHFGGRATATGVGYESRVAAFIAVQMLGGENCVLWENLTGENIVAVTLQTKGAVDDVVVTLRNGTRSFVSAKWRSKAIALTKASAAFAETIADECGFGNVNSMRNVFQRTLKIAPGQYRRHFRHVKRPPKAEIKP